MAAALQCRNCERQDASGVRCLRLRLQAQPVPAHVLPLLCSAFRLTLPACVHHLCTARGWIRFPQQEFNQFRFRAQSSMGFSVCTACIVYAHLPRQPVPHDMATQKVKGYISPFLCTLPLRSHNTMRLRKSQIVHTALQVEPDNFNTTSPSLTRNRSGSLTRSLFATLFIFPII